MSHTLAHTYSKTSIGPMLFPTTLGRDYKRVGREAGLQRIAGAVGGQSISPRYLTFP